MSWLTEIRAGFIRQIDLLPGKPPLLAVHAAGRAAIQFFDLHKGTARGEAALPPPPAVRQGEAWAAFVAALKTPGGTPLPRVQVGDVTVFTSDDGQMRLVQAEGLHLESDGSSVPLDAGDFPAVAFDRVLGLVAALDAGGLLHMFQQNIPLGTFDLNLTPAPDVRLSLAVANGSSAIFACDGTQLVLCDPTGKVLRRVEAHYPIGSVACAPNGALVAAGDVEAGVLRLYSGADLAPLHQRFASDLLEIAREECEAQVTLPEGVALGALAVNNQGTLAFAVGALACVTDVTHMDTLPRARKLL